MTDRKKLALAGVLYLLAFPLYGGGQFLLQDGQIVFGLGLVLMNSAAVVAIGFLLRPIIARASRPVATIVFWGRLLEGLVLGAGAAAFVFSESAISSESVNAAAYACAMIILGAAGVVFSIWMLRAHRIPRILAAYGVVAYVSLATAMILESSGQDALSVWFLAVAGVFEILFALWLILRGFRPDGPGPAST